MRHILLLTFGILFYATSGLQAQADAATAQEFGLSLIQAYYDNQCSYVFDHLDKNITTIEGGQNMAIQGSMKGLFCQDMPIRKDIANGYNKYEDQYQPKVYNHKEFKQQFPTWAKHFQLKAGDFFFDGAHPKAAGHTRLFIAESQARFVLRYQEGDWVIIGL